MGFGSDATFVDFGASSGGSIEQAQNIFGGRGKGLDIDPAKIEKLQSRGYDGLVADVTDIQFDEGSFNYVTLMNFLEHLPSRELAEKAIDSAVKIASDFVFMLGPNFDHANYLRKHGLRKFFSAWSGHSWEHQISELSEILSKYKSYDILLLESERIYDSYNSFVIPNSTPKNSGTYDPNTHGPKPFIKLTDARVYGWVAFVVVKNKRISAEEIILRGLHARDMRPPSSLGAVY